MKARYLLLILFVATLTACRKHEEQPMEQAIQPAVKLPSMPGDKPALKLKDMVVSGLPSPYYHFAYNDSGYIAKAIFASGLSFYDMSYTNKKLSEMAMNKDVPVDTKKDKLKYDYDQGNLTDIRVMDKNGVLNRVCYFTFSASRQLEALEWVVKIGEGFATEMIMSFSYYPDGNLEKIRYSSSPVGSQTVSFYEDKYENYDDKPNADGFSLLHVNPYFFDFILLPSVHLQTNNARRLTHTGDGENYIINYSYTYDTKARPIIKSGDFYYTNGQYTGHHVSLQTTFSYYD